MLELKTHQDIDQLVWSCISESQNPLDYLDYIRHVRNRFAQQELPLNVQSATKVKPMRPACLVKPWPRSLSWQVRGTQPPCSTWGAGTGWAMAWRSTLSAELTGTDKGQTQDLRLAWST